MLFINITEIQEFYLRSQAVQRNLPRPSDINTTILRGALHPEQKMRLLYEVHTCVVLNKLYVNDLMSTCVLIIRCLHFVQAEELIKKEMLHMLQYDLANFSMPGATGKHKVAIEKAKQSLEEKPYEVISLEDMKMVKNCLVCRNWLCVQVKCISCLIV